MIKKIAIAAPLIAIAILFGVKVAAIVATIMAFYFVSVTIDREIKKAKIRLYKWIAKRAGLTSQRKATRTTRTRKTIKPAVKKICADCAGGSHIWCHGKCDCDNRYHAEEAIRQEQAEKARKERTDELNSSTEIPF